MQTESRLRLTPYGRGDCQLWEDVLGQLRKLQLLHDFSLAVVDVDANGTLARRYGDDVPVLAHADLELCRHCLDAGTVTAFLADFR